MNWTDRINTAISYMEENLEGSVDLAETAVKAACSTFYFQTILSSC